MILGSTGLELDLSERLDEFVRRSYEPLEFFQLVQNKVEFHRPFRI